MFISPLAVSADVLQDSGISDSKKFFNRSSPENRAIFVADFSGLRAFRT